MKKRITAILILTIIISISLSLCACNYAEKEAGDAYNKGDDTNIKTEESILDWAIIPDASDVAATTALAKRIYENANRLDKELDYRQAKVYCEVSTKTLGLTITPHQYLYEIKNGDEFYHSEAQTGIDEYCTIKYGTLQSNKMVVFKTSSGVNVSDGVISANLDKAERLADEELPVFHKSQTQVFTKTSFIIDETTMKNVSITHNDNEDGKYFVVEFDIDISKPETVEGPMKGLKAAVPDAKYTSVHEYFEVWESGYYRFFRSVDKWTGTKFVKVEATIDYNTYYSYDISLCNIADYLGAEKLKSELNK